MIKQGWKLIGNDKGPQLLNGKKVLNFDIVMPTTDGVLFCSCLKIDGVESSLAAAKMDRSHELIGHGGKHTKRKHQKI